MNTRKHEQDHDQDHDPLGLRALPAVEPPRDGWEQVRGQLLRDRRSRLRRRAGSWAAAASVAVAVVLLSANLGHLPQPEPRARLAEAPPPGGRSTEAAPATMPAATGDPARLGELVSLSQVLEQRLRRLRGQTGAVAGETALYIAELEDMIARVDGALTEHPDSIDLWGQRVNLMLDLELIYQHHWEREYGRMAAL